MEIIIKVWWREHIMVFKWLTNQEEYKMLDHIEFAAMKRYFEEYKKKGKILSFEEVMKSGTQKQKQMAKKIIMEYKMEKIDWEFENIKNVEDIFKEK